MNQRKSIFRIPFVSALFGGLLTAGVGAALLATGVIEPRPAEKTVVVNRTQQPVASDAVANDKAGPSVQQIYKDDGPGVVTIHADVKSTGGSSPFGIPTPQEGQATGSGFVIDKAGHIVTNAHVVEDATRVTVAFGAAEGEATVPAQVVGVDTSTDTALIKVKYPADKLTPLALADSAGVEVGDPVVAIGNPFNQDRTVTTGIISAIHRSIEAPNGFTINDVIQTDAAINPGNSGGPLIDDMGEVIGVNAQIASPSGANAGIGFAIPSNTVKRIAGELEKNGKATHAYLGITGGKIDEDLTSVLKLPADKGVLVQDVSPGSPAAEAGLRGGDRAVTVSGHDVKVGGDVIVAVDGKPVDDMIELQGIVGTKKPGETIQVTYLRGSERKTAKITLKERPKSFGQGGRQQQQKPQSPDQLPFPFGK